MSTTAPDETARNQPRRSLVRWAVKQVVFLLLVAAAVFIPAGNLGWTGGWCFLGVLTFVQIITGWILVRRAPGLLVERAGIGTGAKRWDIPLALLLAFHPLLISVVAGLDWRNAWSPSLDRALAVVGGAIALAGSLLTLWAMVANPFFSGVVRIQAERGHVVVTAGPYPVVRHPGYVGAVAFVLATPLLLGSAWAWIPAGLVLVVIVVRTALEDCTLRQELDGYYEYARQVRYRLVPGVW